MTVIVRPLMKSQIRTSGVEGWAGQVLPGVGLYGRTFMLWNSWAGGNLLN